MKSFFLICTSCFYFMLSFAQNVGVGTTTPSSPLHVKSTAGFEVLRLEGLSPYISFYNGSGNYKGYVWLNYSPEQVEVGSASATTIPVVMAPGGVGTAFFTTNGRTGLGMSAPTERLDVAGNVNINGILKFNGSTGVAGQVLTSNGSAAPTWKNASYGSLTRFACNATKTGSGNYSYSSIYNLNPADISITASSVTINKTGLYHFEGNITNKMRFIIAPPETEYFNQGIVVKGVTYAFNDMQPGSLVKSGGNYYFDYTLCENFNIDLHVVAPAVVTIYGVGNFATTGSSEFSSQSGSGRITGYLISE